MTWLTLLFAIEAGLLSGYTSVYGQRYERPETYLTLETELQITDYLFVGGIIETQADYLPDNGWLPGFAPSHAVYVFNAGVRLGNFEAGWRHECVHGVDDWNVNGGYDRLYVRGEFAAR